MNKLYSLFIPLCLACGHKEKLPPAYLEQHLSATYLLTSRFLGDIQYKAIFIDEKTEHGRPQLKKLENIVSRYLAFAVRLRHRYDNEEVLYNDFWKEYQEQHDSVYMRLYETVPLTLASSIDIPQQENLYKEDSYELLLAKTYTNALALAVYCQQVASAMYDPMANVRFNEQPVIMIPERGDTFLIGFYVPRRVYFHLVSLQNLSIDQAHTDGSFKARVLGPEAKAIFRYYDPYTLTDKTYEMFF